MSVWKAKRFWKEAVVVAVDGGFSVHLDGRTVKTPAKTALIVPTRAMAAAIAAEWDAQTGEVDPRTMPVTRGANAALDKVAHQHAEVAQMIADYGDSDLLCYRATGPAELIARQAAGWDPVLEWAAHTLQARLHAAHGVMHHPQDPDALTLLSARVHAFDDFELAAFHDLVSLSGSLILGFAVEAGHLPVDAAWQLSRIDEDWQIEQWGEDEEAMSMAATKRSAFLQAKTFLDLARAPD
jgi:chaperone required for assembly of F1-ATPase